MEGYATSEEHSYASLNGVTLLWCTFREARREELVNAFLEQAVLSKHCCCVQRPKGSSKGTDSTATKPPTPVPGSLPFVEKTKIWLNLCPIWHYRIRPTLECPLWPRSPPPRPFVVAECDRGRLHVAKLWSCRCNAASRFFRDRPLRLWASKWNKKVANWEWRGIVRDKCWAMPSDPGSGQHRQRHSWRGSGGLSWREREGAWVGYRSRPKSCVVFPSPSRPVVINLFVRFSPAVVSL
jgi:hypothetical protein